MTDGGTSEDRDGPTEREPSARPPSAEPPEGGPPADRAEPVGAPVVRGDPEITGSHAARAASFDPDDPGSLDDALAEVRAFAAGDEAVDHLDMLRGAAACAALVRGTGSYRAAAARAGVPVGFLQKWARVHDLPIAIRRLVARGDLAPTAARHVARVTGSARFLLAWAAVDHGLSVREVRAIAGNVGDGMAVADALGEHGVEVGSLTLALPPATYLELRRVASLQARSPDDVVAAAVEDWLDGE